MMSAPPMSDPGWALFLDIDGTLIEIAPTPSSIHAPPGFASRLAAIAVQHGGALALVSGRSVDNVLELVAPLRPPVAGLHGLERLDAAGRLMRPPPLPSLEVVRQTLTRFAADHPGLILEDKALSLALHYRQAPQWEAAARAAVDEILASAPGLRRVEGKMVLEVRPQQGDKGEAVRAFMAEAPFAGRLPVFVGDDLTDEDGFAAVNALGGISVLVGPPRPSQARFRLDGIAAVWEWLTA
jgi:trehalose 6-phosphate phosphatase